MTRRADLAARLPIVFGLRIPEAAAAIGVSEGHFRDMQERGAMPKARDVAGVPVIDVDELAIAFKALPHQGDATRQPNADVAEDEEIRL